MTINKYTGKTKEEAVENAKADLGDSVVILNIKEIRPDGLLGIFKKSTFEVTGAVEDELMPRPGAGLRSQTPSGSASGGMGMRTDPALPVTPSVPESGQGGGTGMFPAPSVPVPSEPMAEKPAVFSRLEPARASVQRGTEPVVPDHARVQRPSAAQEDPASGMPEAKGRDAHSAQKERGTTARIPSGPSGNSPFAPLPNPAPALKRDDPKRNVIKKNEEYGFSVAADEKIEIPPFLRQEEMRAAAHSNASNYARTSRSRNSRRNVEKKAEVKKVDPEELRSVFKEVGEVVSRGESVPVPKTKDSESQSPVIRGASLPKDRNKKEKKVDMPVQKRESKGVDTLPPAPASAGESFSGSGVEERLGFVRTLYNTLVDHGVDEKYVNLILDDLGKLISSENSLNYLIQNVYQKMVLKCGRIETIDCSKKPTVIFLVGPTGVGKTTTLAKIASHFKLNEGKQVAFLTADTYRIAATDQLAKYAQILGAPIDIVYEPKDIGKSVAKFRSFDLVLVDTVGFSHKNAEQKEALSQLLKALPERYTKKVFLVLSATTKYDDLKAIVDSYRELCEFSLIFTKLDETLVFGNIYNIRQYSGSPLSYVTNGQMVPDDFSALDSQRLVRVLLGG